MALREVMSKDLRKDSVTAVWEKWAHGTYVVNKDDSEHNDGRYHPSMLFRCPAYIFLYMEQYPMPKDWSPELQRIFGNGDAVHERIQVDLCRAGVLDCSLFDATQETPIHDDKYNIGGHTDGLLNFGPKKATGKTFTFFGKECPIYEFLDASKGRILEIKSMNPWMFDKLKDVKPEHVSQASIYAYVLGLQTIHFLYECKGTQKWKEFRVQRDEQAINAAIRTITLVEEWRKEFRQTVKIPKGVLDQARKSAKNKSLPPWEPKALTIMTPRVGARKAVDKWLREREATFSGKKPEAFDATYKKLSQPKKRRSLTRSAK